MGFETATPIQEQAIPEILEGKDVLACAQTGTGKTAAFLLPVLNLISKHKPVGVSTLILGPTRELVQQVDQQLPVQTGLHHEPKWYLQVDMQ